MRAQPKVDQTQTLVLIYQQVAWVRVRVKEPELEKLAEKAVHTDGDEPADHVWWATVQLLTADPLRREHLSGAQVVKHARYPHLAVAQRLELPAKALLVVRLVRVVKLHVASAGKALNEVEVKLLALCHDVPAHKLALDPFHEFTVAVQNVQVKRHRLQDIRALDLHCYLLSRAVEAQEVDLAQTGSCNRSRVLIKLLELAQDVVAKLCPKQRDRVRGRERRHGVAQLLELVEHGLR
mmetsp:Transcript_17977/g.57468  ORF Transcript_17977/g.57468 Transcript_17977/m.57468 type:complete len:237 (-) Transcript_17977:333-1043(-)